MAATTVLPQQHDLQPLFHPQGRYPLQGRMPYPITLATNHRVQEIEARAHALRLPAHCIGIAQPLDAPVVISGQTSDWVAMRAVDDPNYTQRSGYPMPYEVIETLDRMVAGGLDVFDDVAIVHALPPGVRATTAGYINTEAVRAKYSPAAVERSRRFGAVSGTILRLAALPLLGAAVAGVVAVGAAALAAAPVLAAATLVDPIIFGLVRDETTGNEAWVYLTHWDAYA